MPTDAVPLDLLDWADNDLLYCVIRMPEAFPDYTVGSDLDVLVDDMDDAVGHTMDFLADYVGQFQFSRAWSTTGHLHLDALVGRVIHFRFDFIDTLQVYSFDVDDALKDLVLANRVWDGRAWVPSLEHELALRYMEYREHRVKTRHRDYIDAHPGVPFMHLVREYVDFG